MPEDVYHPAIEISYEIINDGQNCDVQTYEPNIRFDFSKANFKKLIKELSKLSWPIYKEKVEQSVAHFNFTVLKLFEKYVPKRMCVPEEQTQL